MNVCTVEDCNKKVYGHGLCSKHYTQVRNHGSIQTRTIFTPNDYVNKGDFYEVGCYDKYGELVGYFIIDVEDVEKAQQHKWFLDGLGYAKNNRIGYYHNYILGHDTKSNFEIDHMDNNPLNNKKSNLRKCTHQQNCCNRKNKSGYKGVSFRDGQWWARIRVSYRYVFIGRYSTEIEAALAYNKKAKELHGEFASLNKIPFIRRNK